jgi:hypothetical protein
MRQALQIIYGIHADEYTQERQSLLHSTFCSDYSVINNYNSNNNLGSVALSSLELLSFPELDGSVLITESKRLPQSVLNKIFTYLSPLDRDNVRIAFKRNSDNNMFSYRVDPERLKQSLLSPVAVHREVKYVNIEIADDDNHDDVVVDITDNHPILLSSSEEKSYSLRIVVAILSILALGFILLIAALYGHLEVLLECFAVFSLLGSLLSFLAYRVCCHPY